MEALDAAADETPEARAARRIAAAPPGEAADDEAALYRLLAPRIRRYGLRHLRDAHAAADLMQHVMVHTLSRLRAGELREPGRVLSYVLGTCRMTVMEQRRGERRRAELLERYAGDLPAADVAQVAPAPRRGARRRLPRAAARARARRARHDVLRRAPLGGGRHRARPHAGQRARDPAPRHRQAAPLRRRRAEARVVSTGAGGHLSVDALLGWWLHDAASAPRSTRRRAPDAVRRLRRDARRARRPRRRRARGVSRRARLGGGDRGLRRAPRGAGRARARVPAAADGSVECSVAPDDDLLVSRLEAPLAGVERLDAVAVSSLEPGVEHRLEDVPFDATAGEVLWLPKIAQVKALPAHTLRHASRVAPGGARELGRYAFHHRPWAG
jgi:RNA polymerase sigma-70 factor (ECF subfamily)